MTIDQARRTTSAEAQPTLGALVSAALASEPGRCAFRFRGTAMTRGALLEASRATAARLTQHGLEPGEPVAVRIDHSLELVAGICGVLMAGGCVVPIDPALPVERGRAILGDVSPRLFVTGPGGAAEGGATAVAVDLAAPAGTTPFPSGRGGGLVDPGTDLAFIVYTSGSSGGPKGVEITHAGYAARLMHIVRATARDDRDVDLAWTPSSFVGMLDEIFFPLLSGVPAVIAPPEVRADARAFGDLVDRERITRFRITPSLLDVVLGAGVARHLDRVRAIYCSGEVLSADLQRRAHELLQAEIVGFYGATEAPGIAYHIYGRDAPPLATTVCTPQPFAPIRVVRADGTDAAPGEPGEIWIGGPTIARGYRGMPALTAEKFVEADGLRWYRSGDNGRWLDGGRIEILGRADLGEVNVHGVRINLGEVREALKAAQGVADAWVSVVDGTPDPVLVGHCVPVEGSDFEPLRVRTELAASLPRPAVPRILLPRDRFPLTANGKLDIQALAREAAAALARPRAGPAAAPAGPVPTVEDLLKPGAESLRRDLLLRAVIEVAEDTLGVSGLQGSDNFFAAGGDSLQAVRFGLALGERLGVSIVTTLIFNTGSLAEIAEAIATGRAQEASPLRLLRGADGDGTPLFTINAIRNYTALSEHLSRDYPVYNLNIFGLSGELAGAADSFTLEDMAQRFAREILGDFPAGPWRLMAYCQDGALAVEIARVLQASGGADCTLLLVDTFFAHHRPSPWMLAMRAIDLGPAYLLRRFTRRLKKAPPKPEKRRLEDIPVERRAALMGKSRKDSALYNRYVELFRSYRTSRFDGPVVLFVSHEWRHANLSCVERLAGDRLTVAGVPGMHNNLFRESSVAGVAAAIDAALGTDGRRGS